MDRLLAARPDPAVVLVPGRRGVAVLASGPAARGESQLVTALHAAWRSVVLVALGIFLRSTGRPQTNYTFEDTLTQIGLGYFFLYLLARTSPRVQILASAAILGATWGAFALYSPPEGLTPAMTGVTADWPHHPTGFEAHWDKNANAAWAVDRWFLNQFPRETAFAFNRGGYATLSFVPTLATMTLGLLAGGVLRGPRRPWSKVRLFAAAGVAGLAAGYGLGQLGVCPVVKRIWTPTWVLFSGGWCCLMLAAFYAVVDVLGWRGWTFPLAVVGANSIAAYAMEHLFGGFLADALKRHLGADTFKAFGDAYEPLVLGAGVLMVLWLMLFWMYRRRVFIKI